MIDPTDLLHLSPAPHFKTFQVFLICCPKRPSFIYNFIEEYQSWWGNWCVHFRLWVEVVGGSQNVGSCSGVCLVCPVPEPPFFQPGCSVKSRSPQSNILCQPTAFAVQNMVLTWLFGCISWSQKGILCCSFSFPSNKAVYHSPLIMQHGCENWLTDSDHSSVSSANRPLISRGTPRIWTLCAACINPCWRHR